MTETFTLDSFDDFLHLAQAQSEPQRLLFVFTRRELPEGYTEEMKRRFEAGEGGHLAPVVCVDKAPQDLTGFRQLATESEDMVEHWDVIFVAALPGQNGQYPLEDDTNKALENMVENVRQGSISHYLAFDNQGTPLLLDGDSIIATIRCSPWPRIASAEMPKALNTGHSKIQRTVNLITEVHQVGVELAAASVGTSVDVKLSHQKVRKSSPKQQCSSRTML